MKKVILASFVLWFVCVFGVQPSEAEIISSLKKIGRSVKTATQKTAGAVSSGFSKTMDWVKAPFKSDGTDEDSPKSIKEVEELRYEDSVDYARIKRPAKGTVFHKELLSPFGVILITPFRPGTDVADDDVMDDMAIRITRGMSEVFRNKNEFGYYEVVFNEDKQKPDYVIDGYVIEFKDASLLQSITPIADKISLSVKGYLKERETGMLILSFNDTISFRKDQIGYKGLADIAGQNIARFILSNLDE